MMTATPTQSSHGPAKAGVCKALRVAVVIVHYRTPGILRDCVASVLREISVEGARADEVIVVDNDSGAEHVAALSPLRDLAGVRIIESPRNVGFAGANNVGIAAVRECGRAEYYLLLNPDTVVRPGAIATLLRFLEAHPEAACVGPRLEDADGTPQQSAFRNPGPFSEFLRGASIGPITRMFRKSQVYGPIIEEAVATDWLSGACVLMRSSMVEKAGVLDDGFFMYFEEVDYFRRAKRLGLQAWYEPGAHVVHLVGQSSGVAIAPGQKRLPRYWFASRHRFFRKHYGYLGMVMADGFWFCGHVLDRLRKLVTGTSHSPLAKCETRDFLRASLRELAHPFRRVRVTGGRGVA